MVIYFIAVVDFINSECCIIIHAGKAVTAAVSSNKRVNVGEPLGYCSFLAGKTVQIAQFSKNYLTWGGVKTIIQFITAGIAINPSGQKGLVIKDKYIVALASGEILQAIPVV